MHIYIRTLTVAEARISLLPGFQSIRCEEISVVSSEETGLRNMAGDEKRGKNGVEWRIRVGDDLAEELKVEERESVGGSVWRGGKGMILSLVGKVLSFGRRAWGLGVDDPRKFAHCLKVGVALTVVSLFYYLRPLYSGVGGNAMWAILTVVVVYENSVGATVSKSLNRICGTFVAGFLAIGVHWIAQKSGEQLEPIVIGASVFFLASAATFSRFIPEIKARFDYGAMIFILTFSLITISGFRIEELFDMAHQRTATIIIGTSFCIMISMMIYPIWAGGELYGLITRNMDKLAASLDGCVAEIFDENGGLDEDEKPDQSLLGYKCVLASKTTEESLANFARWEPAHGRFTFRHPWKQYLEIGASMRKVAYCIEALNACITSKPKAPDYIKKHLRNSCLKVSSCNSNIIRELLITVKTMRKSSRTKALVVELTEAVKDLQTDLKSLPNLFKLRNQDKPGVETTVPIIIPLVEIIPMATLCSLLVEISARAQSLVDAVQKLADLAEFEQTLPSKLKEEDETIGV